MSQPTTSRAGAAASHWLPRRPSKRMKLRNSTFIIPSTGERSRRHFTLRSSSSLASPAVDHPNPLENGLEGNVNDNDNDNDDDDDNSDDNEPYAVSYTRSAIYRFRSWLASPKGRGVLKCTVAYTIASLWTFWPPLSNLLGKLDGKHMVCTITVYFHPARSAGSMLEATAIAVVAVAYAGVVSVLSMAASVLFGSVLGWVTLAYAVVLVLFIGVAFGFVGWVKQRLNHPSVNVGCTLASLAIITVVTKENAIYTSVFSNVKIVQVLKILVFAIATTATVSLLLWRVSARALLRASFAEATAALTDRLALITHGFLSGAEDELAASSAEYRAATARWATAHAQMTTNLRDAKYEHYAAGHAARYRLEKAVYTSLETLAQSLGGLRSAANTQFELLRESAAAEADPSFYAPGSIPPGSIPLSSIPVPATASAASVAPALLSPGLNRPQLRRASSSFQRSGRLAQLAAIDEGSDESSDERGAQPAEDTADMVGTPPPFVGSTGRINGASLTSPSASVSAASPAPSPAPAPSSRRSSTATLRTSSETFELFIGMLGPSMKSLAFTVASILRDTPFGGGTPLPADAAGRVTNARYRQSLADALALFDAARADALRELYKTIEFGRARSDKIQADFEEVAAACGHFSFSLQAFAEETAAYLDVLDDLRIVRDHSGRSWRWLCFWEGGVLPSGPPPPQHVRGSNNEGNNDDGDAGAVAMALAAGNADSSGSNTGPGMVRPLRKSQLPRGIPDQMVRRRDTFSWQAAPPGGSAVVRGVAQRLLRSFRVLMRDDIRFGIKVGIGAVLWAVLAFAGSTRATYMHWRGEWGLLSFMIVCSNTVGASNTTASARFLATLAGATVAVVNWHLSGGRALALLVLGALVAFGCFVVMVDWGRAPVGRTTLLAYNVVTLYAYSLSQRVDDDDDDEGGLHPLIVEIAKHRFLAVTAGILWGLVVCRVVWPISARRRFQEGVSVLCLQMGLVWRRGPLAVLLAGDADRRADRRQGVAVVAPASAFARSSYLTPREQAALRRYAARLETLRQSAASEFELRGPFPSAAASRILAAINRVLDGFCAMSTLTQRREAGGGGGGGGGGLSSQLSEGERALLYYTAPERAMLCDRIGHVFQVLASSFMLEYPLSDALPDVDLVRDRLLAKIFQFRKEHALLVAGADADGAASAGDALVVNVQERDYALLYAYALLTGQVAAELKTVAKEFEGLFGVLDVEANLLQ